MISTKLVTLKKIKERNKYYMYFKFKIKKNSLRFQDFQNKIKKLKMNQKKKLQIFLEVICLKINSYAQKDLKN